MKYLLKYYYFLIVNCFRLRQHKGQLRMEMCNECGKQLRPLALKLHMVTEHGKQQVPCPKCGKLFKHPSALPRHFKRAHDECQCEECGKVMHRRGEIYLIHYHSYPVAFT